MDVGRHPRIELLTYSEIEDVSGYIGNFHVKVRKKAKYVHETECTACEECSKICPVVVPDEHQVGLSSRKAVYIPFPQAVPSSYLIDMEHCLLKDTRYEDTPVRLQISRMKQTDDWRCHPEASL